MKITCPDCGAVFEGKRCPQCGRRQPRPRSLLKTSTILISTDSDQGVYRSLADVPQALRKKLLKSTTGANAGTILIADRKGRAELSRALGRVPGTWRHGSEEPSEPARTSRGLAHWWYTGASLALAVTLILLWLAFLRH